MPRKAMAIACHPDDIEFMMAGTLLLLKEKGYETHYMNVANGSCGTEQFDYGTIVKMRREEAISATKIAGAVFHESLVNDLEVFYDLETLSRLAAVVREVEPEIILTQYPFDYMEDHSNTCRLAVSAAFVRGMPNFKTVPERQTVKTPVTIYHALPYGLKDPMKRAVEPEFFIDVSAVIETKKKMLAAHRSQKDWLDKSQGMDSYVNSMVAMTGEVGQMSGKFKFAEGWIKHLHAGLCAPDADPVKDALVSYFQLR